MKSKLLLFTSFVFAACNVDHSLGSANPDPDAGLAPTDTTSTSTPPVPDAATPPLADAATPPSSAGIALPCAVIGKDEGGAHCVAAHSTVRVIVPDYSGPLYQLCKGPASPGPTSCAGETKDIMALGGYADVATHEAFCGDQACAIAKIYDQSGKGNHLEPAPGGGAKSTPDYPANASALPVKVNGHQAYGVLIKPGMGYRAGCKVCAVKKGNGMPLGDEPQTVYMVTSQKDLIDGCCFDYGNAETTSNDDGNGAAEAINFGAGVVWGTGSGGKPGPWVLADLENGLFAGWENRQEQQISSNKPLKFDFVTAVLAGDTAEKNGGKGRFALYGADAQGKDAAFGKLTSMYDGIRPEKPGYVPMQKQGSLVLGTAGDNSNGGGGRFYEGATVAGPALSGATLAALQAAIVSAGYGSETTITTPPDTSTPVAGPAQSWTGYVENYQFTSGSDSIKLAYSVDPAGQVTGTITFGNGVAPPPATDPNVGYPPGMNTDTSPAAHLEGSAFAIKSGNLQSNRLRFSIEPLDLWSGWCALQSPPVDGSATCVPNWSGTMSNNTCSLNSPSGEQVPINCGKLSLCSFGRVCACSSTGCIANYQDGGYKTTFDVFLANGTGTGSMTGVFGEHNVHFIKD